MRSPSSDKEDRDIDFGDEQVIVRLNFLDWKFIRLALLAHCLPEVLRLGRSAFHVLLRFWQVFCRVAVCLHGAPFGAEPGSTTNEALWMELEAELAHERMLIEHSRTRLHFLQTDLATLTLNHLDFGDED